MLRPFSIYWYKINVILYQVELIAFDLQKFHVYLQTWILLCHLLQHMNLAKKEVTVRLYPIIKIQSSPTMVIESNLPNPIMDFSFLNHPRFSLCDFATKSCLQRKVSPYSIKENSTYLYFHLPNSMQR